MGVVFDVPPGDAVKRVMIIGGGCDGAAIAAMLTALGLESVRTVQDFRELTCSMSPIEPMAPRLERPPAPKFGDDRPYLKKKKGRS